MTDTAEIRACLPWLRAPDERTREEERAAFARDLWAVVSALG